MAEHMQEIASRSIQSLLASLYVTTGYRPHLEASCEFLGEVNPSTGLICLAHTETPFDIGVPVQIREWRFMRVLCVECKA